MQPHTTLLPLLDTTLPKRLGASIIAILGLNCMGLVLGSTALGLTLGTRTVDVGNIYKNVGVIMYTRAGTATVERFCTGTLIHERVVLTAAHCIMYFASAPAPWLRNVVSFSNDNPRDSSSWIDVTAYLVHPGFPWRNCVLNPPFVTGPCEVEGGGNEIPVYGQGQIDVGLVVLARPVKGIPLATLASANDVADAVGSLMTFVGYGCGLLGSSWDSLRNFGSAPLQSVSDNTAVYANSPAGTGCPGDSGGPTFHNDRVVAVLSDGDDFGSYRSRTDTPVVLRWIAEVIDSVDSVVNAIEFHNAALDHYFVSWRDAEIAVLDAGVTIKGWNRTGQKFRAYSAARTATSPVCRFYLPPAYGDSHFYGRGIVECDATAAKNPGFVLEEPQFMYMILPIAGDCPANTTPVYRVFNNRPDTNHRYMVDPAIRDQMMNLGWLAEGDGPNLVVMCAPQ